MTSILANLAEFTAALAEPEGRKTAFQDQERTEFWKAYGTKRDQDYYALLYANEEIALDCVTKLVKDGLLDRATMFRDEGLGFADVVWVIADVIAESLSKPAYQEHLAYFIEGQPAEVEPTPSEQAEITAHEYAMETTFGVDVEPPAQAGAE